MQRADLRVLLQSKLREDVTDELWNYLDERGFVEDARSVGSIDGLVEEAQWIRRAGTSRLPRESKFVERQSGPSIGQERAWALSRLVSDHAERDVEVVEFRAKYLPHGPIQWSEFEDWLQEQVATQGPLTRDLTTTLPAGTELAWVGVGYTVIPPISKPKVVSVSARVLDYALPGDEWVRRQAVAAGGVLDRLRVIAESLADAFAWQPVQATIFVVCGTIPFVAPVRMSTTPIKTRYDFDLPWARRIKLDIDPSATPQEVVAAYKRARQQLGLDRARTLSLKHLRLAVFAGVDHADTPWAERHRLWNARFPEWCYSQESNFRRDATRACERVLGEQAV